MPHDQECNLLPCCFSRKKGFFAQGNFLRHLLVWTMNFQHEMKSKNMDKRVHASWLSFGKLGMILRSLKYVSRAKKNVGTYFVHHASASYY